MIDEEQQYWIRDSELKKRVCSEEDGMTVVSYRWMSRMRLWFAEEGGK
jgi:hypothetical protein